MTSPFAKTEIKIFPLAGEIMLDKISCKTPQELWDRCMSWAQAYTPAKGGPLGDMAFLPIRVPSPEVAEHLRRFGRFKVKVIPSARAKLSLSSTDIEDLNSRISAALQRGDFIGGQS